MAQLWAERGFIRTSLPESTSPRPFLRVSSPKRPRAHEDPTKHRSSEIPCCCLTPFSQILPRTCFTWQRGDPASDEVRECLRLGREGGSSTGVRCDSVKGRDKLCSGACRRYMLSPLEKTPMPPPLRRDSRHRIGRDTVNVGVILRTVHRSGQAGADVFVLQRHERVSGR